jgi:hypothetical protein
MAPCFEIKRPEPKANHSIACAAAAAKNMRGVYLRLFIPIREVFN